MRGTAPPIRLLSRLLLSAVARRRGGLLAEPGTHLLRQHLACPHTKQALSTPSLFDATHFTLPTRLALLWFCLLSKGWPQARGHLQLHACWSQHSRHLQGMASHLGTFGAPGCACKHIRSCLGGAGCLKLGVCLRWVDVRGFLGSVVCFQMSRV